MPTGTGSLANTTARGITDGVAEVSAGDSVGAAKVADALTAGDGDVVTTVDGADVQPATAATRTRPSRRARGKLGADIFNDLTDSLPERNALH